MIIQPPLLMLRNGTPLKVKEMAVFCTEKFSLEIYVSIGTQEQFYTHDIINILLMMVGDVAK